jgi:hypothetical protein
MSDFFSHDELQKLFEDDKKIDQAGDLFIFPKPPVKQVVKKEINESHLKWEEEEVTDVEDNWEEVFDDGDMLYVEEYDNPELVDFDSLKYAEGDEL